MQNNNYNAYQTQMGFMNGDINDRISAILNLANAGRNPQELINQLIQTNPQVSGVMTQMNNMRGKMSMNDFVIQLARQNGVNEQNIQGMMRLFGIKK